MQEGLSQEWRVLQQQAEGYEMYALACKAAGLTVTIVGLLQPHWSWLGLLALCHLQEAIGRTLQGRLTMRLEKIETALLSGNCLCGQVRSDTQRS